MPFTLSPATEDDIPSLLVVWNSAFSTISSIFPTTPAGEAYKRKCFEKMMRERPNGCVFHVISDDSEKGRKVVAYAIWYKYGAGEWDPDWRARWEGTLAEGMSLEMIEEKFFKPMGRQHGAVMGGRAHWCMRSSFLLSHFPNFLVLCMKCLTKGSS